MIALCCLTGMQAQEERNELAISYGAGTRNNWEGLAANVVGAFAGTTTTLEYTGSFSMQYFRYLTPKIAVGGIATYEHADGTVETNVLDYKTSETEKHNYFTVMPAAKFMWFNKTSVGMYSKLAAGAMIDYTKADKESDTSTYFAFQASAIGIEAGNARVRGFAELGYGTLGLLVAGIKATF